MALWQKYIYLPFCRNLLTNLYFHKNLNAHIFFNHLKLCFIIFHILVYYLSSLYLILSTCLIHVLKTILFYNQLKSPFYVKHCYIYLYVIFFTNFQRSLTRYANLSDIAYELKIVSSERDGLARRFQTDRYRERERKVERNRDFCDV